MVGATLFLYLTNVGLGCLDSRLGVHQLGTVTVPEVEVDDTGVPEAIRQYVGGE